MKIFCSYACSGEDQQLLTARMRHVVDVLEGIGHEVYCYHFSAHRSEDTTPRQAMQEALSKLGDYDALFAIIASGRRSEGQLIEIGAALSQGKALYVAEHISAIDATYVPTLADETFIWSTLDDLVKGIRDCFEGASVVKTTGRRMSRDAIVVQ